MRLKSQLQIKKKNILKDNGAVIRKKSNKTLKEENAVLPSRVVASRSLGKPHSLIFTSNRWIFIKLLFFFLIRIIHFEATESKINLPARTKATNRRPTNEVLTAIANDRDQIYQILHLSNFFLSGSSERKKKKIKFINRDVNCEVEFIGVPYGIFERPITRAIN